MSAISAVPLSLATLWFVIAVAAGIAIYRRKGSGRLRPEQGLALGGTGLLALAPLTYLATYFIADTPALFGSAVQCAGAALLFAASLHTRRLRLNPQAEPGTRSFAEKSALLVLIAVLAVFGMYFVDTFGSSPAGAMTAFVRAVILLIVITIAGHIAIAVFHAPHDDLENPADERDREISRRSLRNAYYALAAGFWSMPVLIALPVPTLQVLQSWLFFLVISEVVYQGSIVRYYRVGID